MAQQNTLILKFIYTTPCQEIIFKSQNWILRSKNENDTGAYALFNSSMTLDVAINTFQHSIFGVLMTSFTIYPDNISCLPTGLSPLLKKAPDAEVINVITQFKKYLCNYFNSPDYPKELPSYIKRIVVSSLEECQIKFHEITGTDCIHKHSTIPMNVLMLSIQQRRFNLFRFLIKENLYSDNIGAKVATIFHERYMSIQNIPENDASMAVCGRLSEDYILYQLKFADMLFIIRSIFTARYYETGEVIAVSCYEMELATAVKKIVENEKLDITLAALNNQPRFFKRGHFYFNLFEPDQF